jgi:hypothetical protein
MAAAAMFLLASCKKEYIGFPYNNIEQFTVTDAAGNQLKAVIGEDNSILLYWTPFAAVPDSIVPVIAVSSQASIEPGSGVRVPFKEGTVYTVRAQDGSSRTYTLRPVINTPVPVFTVNNTALSLGDELVLNGEYIIPDTARTKLYLRDKNNRDIQLTGFSTFYSTTIHVSIPLSIDTGSYQIRLVSGANIVTQGPYYIQPFSGNPFAGNTTYAYQFNEAGQTVSLGSELSFNYSTSGGAVADYILPRQRLWVFSSGDDFSNLHDVEVSSLTATTVKFRLPADLPAGMLMFYIVAVKEDGNAEILYAHEGDPPTYVSN